MGCSWNCFNEPDFSSWRNLVYLGDFYAAGQLLHSVFHLKTVRVLNLLISQDLGAFLNFLRKFFTKFIKQMKDLNVALQLCQAMVMYWAYLVSGFTEPLLLDDVLGTHHHVLPLWHPVHQSGRHRHRVLQGRHLGSPVQTERKQNYQCFAMVIPCVIKILCHQHFWLYIPPASQMDSLDPKMTTKVFRSKHFRCSRNTKHLFYFTQPCLVLLSELCMDFPSFENEIKSASAPFHLKTIKIFLQDRCQWPCQENVLTNARWCCWKTEIAQKSFTFEKHANV